MLSTQRLQTVRRFCSFFQEPMNMRSSGGTFYAKDLRVSLREKLLPLPPFEMTTLPFGKHHSDHMMRVFWNSKSGWGVPNIEPFQDLEIHPFNSTLHYGLECFEGLKAYKNQAGEVLVFRPRCNIYRLKRSSESIALPDFDGTEFLRCLEEFLRIEARWIPPKREFSLYIRPLHISMENRLGIGHAEHSQLLILAGPVGPYYPSGFNPISLYCTAEFERSAPGGTAHFKIGSNYAPTIMPGKIAERKGHQQILWLHEQQVVEVGTSNIFFALAGAGGTEIVPPPLQDLILPGVTRDSVLTFLRAQGKYLVNERVITIEEVLEKNARGEVLEIFGSGTATLVTPVKNIHYEGVDYPIRLDPQLNAGPIAAHLREAIMSIQEGRVPDPFGWVHHIK